MDTITHDCIVKLHMYVCWTSKQRKCRKVGTDWLVNDWTFTRPGFTPCLEQNYLIPDNSFLSPPLFHVSRLSEEMWTGHWNRLHNNQVAFMCSGSRKVNINCTVFPTCALKVDAGCKSWKSSNIDQIPWICPVAPPNLLLYEPDWEHINCSVWRQFSLIFRMHQ